MLLKITVARLLLKEEMCIICSSFIGTVRSIRLYCGHWEKSFEMNFNDVTLFQTQLVMYLFDATEHASYRIMEC